MSVSYRAIKPTFQYIHHQYRNQSVALPARQEIYLPKEGRGWNKAKTSTQKLFRPSASHSLVVADQAQLKCSYAQRSHNVTNSTDRISLSCPQLTLGMGTRSPSEAHLTSPPEWCVKELTQTWKKSRARTAWIGFDTMSFTVRLGWISELRDSQVVSTRIELVQHEGKISWDE